MVKSAIGCWQNRCFTDASAHVAIGNFNPVSIVCLLLNETMTVQENSEVACSAHVHLGQVCDKQQAALCSFDDKHGE
jgi:hypothetical protein